MSTIIQIGGAVPEKFRNNHSSRSCCIQCRIQPWRDVWFRKRENQICNAFFLMYKNQVPQLAKKKGAKFVHINIVGGDIAKYTQKELIDPKTKINSCTANAVLYF